MKTWVGRALIEGTVTFNSLKEAEDFVAAVAVLFPMEVEAGELYIDADEVESQARRTQQ